MKDEKIEPIKRIIEAGSNIVGAASGGVLGFILGDTQGAAIGGVAGATLTGVIKVLGDVAHRSLSRREEARIGTAAYFAIEKIKIKLESGENPREDSFFQEREYDSRSNAEEIFEGALLKSKNEHEEKKIRIIANIFANTALDSTISVSEANHILQIAENMTYRQICLLALFERKAEIEDVNLVSKEIYQGSSEDVLPVINDLSALQEIYQLNNLGLVARAMNDSKNVDGWSDSQIITSSQYVALLALDDVVPDQMILTELGKRYYSIMNLSEIPKEDLTEVAITLSE